MSETIEKKEVCRCKSCGNEAEMTFVCTLPDEEDVKKEPTEEPTQGKAPQQVKGTATCTHCGNEADMWIDL